MDDNVATYIYRLIIRKFLLIILILWNENTMHCSFHNYIEKRVFRCFTCTVVISYQLLAIQFLFSSLGCENKTLGLRDDDGLPYYYFQGTSHSPESTNKNINKNSPDGATWCPNINKTNNSFLEVDLGKQYLLCGVSTQGNDSNGGFTKSYKIELSSDRIQWKFYQDNGTDKV